jgi:excisionase family DNA binding protein
MTKQGCPVAKKLTLDDVAEELCMSKRSVRRLISTGRLRAYLVGERMIRIDRDDLDKALTPITPSGKDW